MFTKVAFILLKNTLKTVFLQLKIIVFHFKIFKRLNLFLLWGKLNFQQPLLKYKNTAILIIHLKEMWHITGRPHYNELQHSLHCYTVFTV